MKNVQKVH